MNVRAVLVPWRCSARLHAEPGRCVPYIFRTGDGTHEPAKLLDELNSRIEDADAAIGPSYLMDPRIYQREDGVERVRQYWIMPLLTDQFYGQTDLEEQYGLAALRRAVGLDTANQPPGPPDDDHVSRRRTSSP